MIASPAREIILPYPHPGQRIVRRQAKRFNWLAAGRRWRKTTLCMAIAVEAAAQGQRVLWGAPVSDECWIAWEETKRAAGGVAVFNQSRMSADFGGRGCVFFRSLDDPDNARGHGADGIVLDECGEISSEAWQVVRPMLLDTVGGWVWGIGTPKGFNWFQEEHAAVGDRDDSAAWQAPTLGVRIGSGGLERAPHPLENPEVSFEEIKQLFDTMPSQTFAQEILAEFVASGSGVFRGVIEACTSTQVAKAEPGHSYVFGVDWGKLADFTVISVIDQTTRRQVWLERFNQIDYYVQKGRLAILAQRYKPQLIVAEANAMGAPNVEDLQRMGLPVWAWTPTNASKAEAIESLSLAIERGDLALLKDQVQTGELLAFSAERLPGGMVRYGGPGHDDTVVALALAWSAAKTPPAPAPRAYTMSVGARPRSDADRAKLFFGNGVNGR